ncbi:MAG: DUF3999 family protein [Cytophagales bacterium]|nr:DUF3999 family protein [Cytophagales bacterium]
MKLNLNLLAALLLTAGTLQAQFKFERKISEVTATNWYSIELPIQLHQRVKPDFSDVRIFKSDNDSTEIPYFIRIAADAQLRQPVVLEPYNISRQGTVLFFTIKPNQKLKLNQVFLEFEQATYDAEVTVEGSNDEKEWFTIHSSRILSLTDPVAYTYNQVNFSGSRYNYIRFAVNNKTALTLKRASFYQSKIKSGNFSLVDGTLTAKTVDKKTEFFLNFEHPVLISQLSMEAAPHQLFYRTISIDWLADSTRTDKGTYYSYRNLYTGAVSSFQQDTLKFSPQVVQQLRVTLHNQDNPPVQVTNIRCWSPRVELITHLQPGSYRLQYGQAYATLPRYDLAHFNNEIPDSLARLELSSELKPTQEVVTESHPWFKSKVWIWAALVAIILVLGFFTMRMLREP